MKTYLIIFFLLAYGHAFSQSDKDEDQQLIYSFLYSKEIEKAKVIIDSKFINSDNNSKKVIGYVYLADYYSINNEEEKINQALENAKKIADKTQNKIDEAYVEYGFAKYYRTLNKNDLFIKSLNKSINIFSNLPSENFILAVLYEQKMNYIEENPTEKLGVSDYLAANKYALKSQFPLIINWTYNNLGNYFTEDIKLKKNNKSEDSAKYYYGKSFQEIKLIKEPAAQKKALLVYYVNNGRLLTEISSAQIPTALTLFNQALAISNKNPNLKDYVCAIRNNMGYAYEKMGENELAKDNYLIAYNQSDVKEVFAFQRIRILINLTNIYQKLNQPEKALKYSIESYDLSIKTNQEQFDNNIKSLEIFYQSEQKNRNIKQLKEKNKAFATQKILYIAVILLTLTVIVFLFFSLKFSKKFSKQKTDILEIERNEIELQLELEKTEKARLKVEQELLHLKQMQLHKDALSISMQLDHKNSVLSELKGNLKGEYNLDIKKILKEEELTNNDFEEMQNMIQKLHPELFKRLKEVSKVNLTILDLKYTAYIYMNMDNLQISTILKVDPKTVRVKKYRLKQKLGLDKEDNLQNFIQNLV